MGIEQGGSSPKNTGIEQFLSSKEIKEKNEAEESKELGVKQKETLLEWYGNLIIELNAAHDDLDKLKKIGDKLSASSSKLAMNKDFKPITYDLMSIRNYADNAKEEWKENKVPENYRQRNIGYAIKIIMNLITGNKS